MRSAAGALGGAALVVAPFVVAGAWWNMLAMVSGQVTHDSLSNEALNLWWIVGNVMLAGYTWMRGANVWDAVTFRATELEYSRATEHGFPHLRLIAALLALAAILWAVWTARRVRDVPLVAALAAFCVHAYATVGPQVHENHLFAAVPLLAVAAAGRRAFVPIFVAVSTLFALNIAFWGIGIGAMWLALPRRLTVVDTTLLVAAASCAVLAWHAAILRREVNVAG
jgi:hypothetical protein